MQNKSQERTDKRAAALRDNLKRRKERQKEIKSNNKEEPNQGNTNKGNKSKDGNGES